MLKIISRRYNNIIFERDLCISCIRKCHNQLEHLSSLSLSRPWRHLPWSRHSYHQLRTISSLHNLNTSSVIKKSEKMSIFKFSDYDCVGFDLDNTLLSYNITNMVKLEYEVLAKFMVEKRGYDAEFLNKPLLDEDIDFLQKGLILDFDAGNVLKIASDGKILRASHGTKILSTEDIEKIYPNRKWEATDALIDDTLETWNGPISLKMRSLLDYFDMPISLIFGRAIDSIDSKESKSPQAYNVWPDCLDGAIDMFDGKNFKEDSGHYFPALKNNPEKYLRKCSPVMISWLRELRRKRVTYLITGSHADFADFTATHALGKDWKSLFDIVVCYAKKPGFFTGERPFVSMSGYEENERIAGGKLTRGEIYSQGNWRELENFFRVICKKDSPRCVYVGDNLIQDIYVPGAHADCDTVVLSDELQAEGMIDLGSPHPDEKILNSTFWGSYFCLKDSESIDDSLWCGIMKKYSKICVSSMEIIARNNIDETYECFEKNDKVGGFYPAKPRTLS